MILVIIKAPKIHPKTCTPHPKPLNAGQPLYKRCETQYTTMSSEPRGQHLTHCVLSPVLQAYCHLAPSVSELIPEERSSDPSVWLCELRVLFQGSPRIIAFGSILKSPYLRNLSSLSSMVQVDLPGPTSTQPWGQ